MGCYGGRWGQLTESVARVDWFGFPIFPHFPPHFSLGAFTNAPHHSLAANQNHVFLAFLAPKFPIFPLSIQKFPRFPPISPHFS